MKALCAGFHANKTVYVVPSHIPSDIPTYAATVIDGSSTQVPVPETLTSILRCNEEHWSYSESRKAWSSEHSATWIPTSSVTTVTLYSTSTSTIESAPTITLCDGVGRAGNDLVSTITWTSSVFVSTRAFQSLSHPEFPIPKPGCTAETGLCSEASSFMQSHTSDFLENWNLPCDSNTAQTCTACVITARQVKLYHWPLPTTIDCSPTPASPLTFSGADNDRASPLEPTGSTGDNIVTSDGITFTSPLLYLSFYDINATDTGNAITCGGPLPTGAQAIVHFDPSEVSSVRYGTQQGMYSFNVNDLAHTTASGGNTPIPLVSSAAYYGQYRCNFGGNQCPLIRDDYRPTIAIPTNDPQLKTMDEAWANCNAFDAGYGLQVVAVEEIGKGEAGLPTATERTGIKTPRAALAGMVTFVP